MYVCKSIDRTVVLWFARIGYTQPLICNYTDCAPCTAMRRASKLVEPRGPCRDSYEMDLAEREPSDDNGDSEPDVLRSPL